MTYLNLLVISLVKQSPEFYDDVFNLLILIHDALRKITAKHVSRNKTACNTKYRNSSMYSSCIATVDCSLAHKFHCVCGSRAMQ